MIEVEMSWFSKAVVGMFVLGLVWVLRELLNAYNVDDDNDDC